MKIRVSAEVLAKALAPVTRAAKGEQSAKGALLRAEGGNALTLVGTDGTTAVRTSVPEAEVQEEGTVLVSAQRLNALVRALQPGVITLATAKAVLRVRGGDFAATLSLMPAGNFPALSDVTGAAIAFDPIDFKRAVSQVLPAVSTDPNRTKFHGVQIRMAADSFALAATDGVRVAESTIKAAGDRSKWKALLHPVVPASVLLEARLAGAYQVVRDEDRIAFVGDRFKIMTRVMDVDFPDYTKFMAAKFASEFTADKPALIQAIGRVNLLADEMSALSLSVQDGRMLAVLNAPGIGDASEHVAVEGKGTFGASFNPRLVYDGITGADGASVKLLVNEPLRPVLFTDGNGYKYLLMPVRQAKKND